MAIFACLFSLLAVIFRFSFLYNIALSDIIICSTLCQKNASDTFLECQDLWDFLKNHSGQFYVLYHTSKLTRVQ